MEGLARVVAVVASKDSLGTSMRNYVSSCLLRVHNDSPVWPTDREFDSNALSYRWLRWSLMTIQTQQLRQYTRRTSSIFPIDARCVSRVEVCTMFHWERTSPCPLGFRLVRESAIVESRHLVSWLHSKHEPLPEKAKEFHHGKKTWSGK